MHSSGRHTDPSSTASNFSYTISVVDSPTKKYQISCFKRQVMLISSMLFLIKLMRHEYSMLLEVLTRPLKTA